jgi:hypothetical protein
MQDADILTSKLSSGLRPVQNFLLVAGVGKTDTAAEKWVDDEVGAKVCVVLAVIATRARARAGEVEECSAIEEEVALLRVEQ